MSKRILRIASALTLLALSACYPGEKQFEGQTASRMHADWLPPHSLRLVQVVDIGTRAEIEEIVILPSEGLTMYQDLKAAGIPDDEIHDGSAAAGIAFCCGGDISKETLVMFYVPEGMEVSLGDVVEIKVGEPPRPGNLGTFPNTMTRVRQEVDNDTACSWEPDNPNLWARVLYCRGLEEEGWVQAERKIGREALWYRPQ